MRHFGYSISAMLCAEAPRGALEGAPRGALEGAPVRGASGPTQGCPHSYGKGTKPILCRLGENHFLVFCTIYNFCAVSETPLIRTRCELDYSFRLNMYMYMYIHTQYVYVHVYTYIMIHMHVHTHTLTHIHLLILLAHSADGTGRHTSRIMHLMMHEKDQHLIVNAHTHTVAWIYRERTCWGAAGSPGSRQCRSSGWEQAARSPQSCLFFMQLPHFRH